MLSTILFSTLVMTQASPTVHVDVKDDVVGKGPLIKAGDVVAVNYTGSLADGTTFDTTQGKNPFLFMVGASQVIKGWDLGIVGMHEGGKRELTIPPLLGYGAKKVQAIPANSTLHFTITLVKLEPKVQITVLTPGTGQAARVGDIAYVYFTGGVQGKKVVFDTKDGSKDPVDILIGESKLPIGFVPSLVGMHEGETRRVVIPSELAYGKMGVPKQDQGSIKAGSVIPPDSVMEFTFQLVKLVHEESK